MGEDERLVELAQEGDIAAFEELVTRYQDKVYHMTLGMMRHRQDAEDATQEAFLKAYEAIGGFKGRSKFSTWLYRIAKNTCLDMIRKKSRRRTFSLDKPMETDEGEVEREISGALSNPEEELRRDSLRELVKEGLATISPKYRVAVILRDMQGLSYREIAAILDCSLGTVKSRLYRGRQQLKDFFAGRELFDAVDVNIGEGGSRYE